MDGSARLQQLASYYRDVLAVLLHNARQHYTDLRAVAGKGYVADLSPFVGSLEQVVASKLLTLDIERASPDAIGQTFEEAETAEEAGPRAPQEEKEDASQQSLADRQAMSIRLTAIYRKQEQDPFNRETIVGLPLLAGRYGPRGFCAPLFYYVVRLEHHPLESRMTITKEQDVPLLNTTLLSSLVAEGVEVDLVRQKLFPLLFAEEFTLDTIEASLRMLAELVEGLRGLRHHAQGIARVHEAVAACSHEGAAPVCVDACVVINAPRAHAFLQDDLVKLSRSQENPRGTVASFLLEEPGDAPPGTEEPPDLSTDVLLFPLMSNAAQRRVAGKVQRSRLMAVQGPPGTGKSQTIANLVCHLVGQGKTVLVTSHQNKALEVVMDKLPRIEYLAMPLLRGDRDSADALRNQLEEYDTAVANASVPELESRWARALRRLRELQADIGKLQARFSELRALEHECTGPFQRYHEIREYDGIHPDDEVGDTDQTQLVESLKLWRRYLEDLAPSYADLLQSFVLGLGLASPSAIETAAAHLAQLLKLYDDAVGLLATHQEERHRLAEWERIIRLARRNLDCGWRRSAEIIAPVLQAAVGITEEVRQALDVAPAAALVAAASERLEDSALAIQAEGRWLAGHWSDLMAALGKPSGLGSLKQAIELEDAAGHAAAEAVAKRTGDLTRELQGVGPIGLTAALRNDGQVVAAVGLALGPLSRAARSWLLWHLSPGVRRARGTLRQVGLVPPGLPGARAFLQGLRQWHTHWSLRHEINAWYRHARDLGLRLDVPATDAPLIHLAHAADALESQARLLAAVAARPRWQGPRPLGDALQSQLDGVATPDELTSYRPWVEAATAVIQARSQARQWAEAPGTRELARTDLCALATFAATLRDQAAACEASQWAASLLDETAPGVPTLVAARLDQLDSLDALRHHRALEAASHTWLAPCFEAIETGQFDASRQARERLAPLLQHAPLFCAYLTFAAARLVELPRTRDHVEKYIAVNSQLPRWMSRPDLAAESHRLRQLVIHQLVTDVDDINSVAQGIAHEHEEYRKTVVRVLEVSRRLALKHAQTSPDTRRSVIKLRTLLRRRRKTVSFLHLREQIDYPRLLKVFPCWIMSIDDVARVFPLVKGLFDYVIVDEASQCQQAAALHLAYRARSMVVVGDRKQLQNPSTRFLSQQIVDLLLTRHKLDLESVKFDARKSLLELAEYCAPTACNETLSEHFRCEPPIIAWSNREFYNNQLVVMTPIRLPRFTPCLELRLVHGAADDPDRKANVVEAQAVVAEAERLIKSGEVTGLSLGLISPYRQQANLMHNMLHERMAEHPDLIRRHQLVAATADGFQGDERDIILYSFRYGPGSPPSAVTAIQLERERLNVAFTRARRKAICFVSLPPERFPRGLIRSFLMHALDTQHGRDVLQTEDHFESLLEERVCMRLRALNYSVHTQVPCGAYRIDLVVEDPEGRRLAVECDGEFHYEHGGDLRPEDYQRQDLLERAGWTVYRVPARRFYWDPDATVGSIASLLKRVETGKEQAFAQQDMNQDLQSHVSDARRVCHETPVAQTVEADRRLATREPSGRKARKTRARPTVGRHVPTEATCFQFKGMDNPENWFRLSHWGKITGKFSGYNNTFSYDMGRLLARKSELTERQLAYAHRVWEMATRLGFSAEAVSDE